MGVTAATLHQQACAAIDAATGNLIALSRAIHAAPEPAWQEHATARRLVEFLRALPGATVEEHTADLPTAFRAWAGTADGPTVGVIAEYDALPGLGHACGHNLIAAAAAGALVGVAAVADRLPGRVMVIGSPAEEGGGGKIAMARRGAYDGLAAVLQVHPADRHRLSGPTIGLAVLAVEFRGRAAHAGSAPERGVNALDAVVQLFTALNAMRQQVPDGCRLYGIITRGGETLHTVPDHTAAQVGVRAPTLALLDGLAARVEDCARAAALATGCTVTVERPPLSQYPPMRLNRTLGCLLADAMRSLGEEVEDFPPGPEGYANDAAVVSRLAPAALLNFGIGPRGLAEHSAAFAAAAASEAGHRGMLQAAKAMAIAAVELITDPALRRRVREEFERGDA